MKRPNKKTLIIAAVIVVLILATTTTAAASNTQNEYDMFLYYVNYIIDKWEGPYENVAGDRGGETAWGITKKDYPNINIKTLTKSAAIDIYYSDYWQRAKMSYIPSKIAFMHFAGVINFGVSGQTQCLQEAAGTTKDGILGLITIAKAQFVTPEQLLKAQKNRYDRIIANAHSKGDYSQDRFYNGWINRINDIYDQQIKVNQYS